MGLIPVNPPSGKTERKLTKEDVWGTFNGAYKITHRGMIVAQGFSSGSKEEYAKWKEAVQVSDICPVWKDKLPYKSVTVICDEAQVGDVMYWLHYVHGGDCISNEKKLPDGKYAIRSNYMCW